MVPNQPLVVRRRDGRERKEDEIIAYTWDKFLRTGDERWPVRLPMTKAVVRAMDTVTALLRQPAAGGDRGDRSIASSSPAPRSAAGRPGRPPRSTRASSAIVPIVIDVLNVEPSFDHHCRAYGFYAPAVKDYEDAGDHALARHAAVPRADARSRIRTSIAIG